MINNTTINWLFCSIDRRRLIQNFKSLVQLQITLLPVTDIRNQKKRKLSEWKDEHVRSHTQRLNVCLVRTKTVRILNERSSIQTMLSGKISERVLYVYADMCSVFHSTNTQRISIELCHSRGCVLANLSGSGSASASASIRTLCGIYTILYCCVVRKEEKTCRCVKAWNSKHICSGISYCHLFTDSFLVVWMMKTMKMMIMLKMLLSLLHGCLWHRWNAQIHRFKMDLFFFFFIWRLE